MAPARHAGWIRALNIGYLDRSFSVPPPQWNIQSLRRPVKKISWLGSLLPHWEQTGTFLRSKWLPIKFSIWMPKETVFLIYNLWLNEKRLANIDSQPYDVKLVILLKEEVVTSSSSVGREIFHSFAEDASDGTWAHNVRLRKPMLYRLGHGDVAIWKVLKSDSSHQF